MSNLEREALILPIDTLIKNIKKIILESNEVKAIQDGKTLLLKNYDTGIYRLYSYEEIFLGLGDVDSHGYLKVRRLLATN